MSTDVDDTRLIESDVRMVRAALFFSGVTALVVGVLILAWPDRTAKVVAAIIAVYALIDGIAYAASSFSPRSGLGGLARIGHLILGLVFIAAGVIAMSNLGHTTRWLAVLLGIMIGITWIIEGLISLTALSLASSKALAVVFAVLSILAGIALLLSPLWGATVLWWMLGISLVVVGGFQVARSLRLRAV